MYLNILGMNVTIFLKSVILGTISNNDIPGLEFQRSRASSVSISEERRLNAAHHFVDYLPTNWSRPILWENPFLDVGPYFATVYGKTFLGQCTKFGKKFQDNAQHF